MREAGPMVATIFVRRSMGVREGSGPRFSGMCPRWVTRLHGPSSKRASPSSKPRDDTPSQPTDLPKDAWLAILKRTFKQFSDDQLTTWAAAPTYFGVLSLFPMMLALVSILGVIGPSATRAAARPAEHRRPRPGQGDPDQRPYSLESNQGGSTVALIIGLAAAIWSASG